jgi:hypothetical protein
LISFAEPAQDLDRVDRAAAKLHLRARRFARLRIELEQAHRALLLAKCRTSDEQDVFQALEFNRAVDAEVGPRTARQLALEPDVNRNRAVLRRGVDANDPAGNDALARVDRGDLADRQVARLRLGDAQFRLEARRIRNANEVGAGLHLLADFHRHLLEHAGHAGAHAQLIDLLAAKVVGRSRLIDLRLRCREPRTRARL